VAAAGSFRRVADSALCQVSLVVQSGHHCEVERTYLLELDCIGSADDVRSGSHSGLSKLVLAESTCTVRWSRPLWSSIARLLSTRQMSSTNHCDLCLAVSGGCQHWQWWSGPVANVMR